MKIVSSSARPINIGYEKVIDKVFPKEDLATPWNGLLKIYQPVNFADRFLHKQS